MTMNPFEQSTQQLLRFLTSHAEWEVIDYIRQEIQHDAPDSVPTAEELLTFFQSPDAPTELDTYQQMLVTDKLGCSFISNLQENVERIYCKMDGKINWLFIEQKPRFSGVSNEINSSA